MNGFGNGYLTPCIWFDILFNDEEVRETSSVK